MGVPKFFRYISERYPCLSELAREQSIPNFDNLYLDMNGIIHNCSHPDDTNIHFNITEEEMFEDIFNYIDKLFFLIKPQKLFFMAIDGVAPRAKMNQQRSRRFRSAKEAEILEKLANSRGEERQHERFDSNCITPGTEFMDRLHEALRYFIKSKISADPLWQKCRVILSGHNSPGEGEHKIMDYIRYLKSQSDFNPNTRHCLYGLDADLIILGLCTHELHFVILREEVKFGKKTKKASVEETRFFLLHLGLLREYLELEFDEIKQQDPNFNIANLIDDWVLMGFLIGNDFIPHLPCLHISSNALPLLYKTYKQVYGSLGGNINENGKLNLPRLEKYFTALADVEFEIFQKNHADLKYFDAKQSKSGVDEAFDFDVSEINNENTDNDLAALIESSRQFLEDDDENLSDNEQHINDEFANYKRNYYMSKLNKDNSNSELAKEQAVCYITALQWILDYYYCGVQSWDWYYPHHYAPFISDLKGFQEHEIKFNMGKPFLPFQQLLAVLPAASKTLLPAAYRDLMTNENSELIGYYPEDFDTDLNGKQHEWEAVVLIPFIDEKKLLDAMAGCEKDLSPSERKRNQHGPMFQYDYNAQSQGQVPGIYSLKSLQHVFCTEKPLWSKDILVSPHKTVCVELPNAARTEFFPGFPTMKHLSYKFEIKNSRVKVFDYPSRNENMILQPEIRKNLDNIDAVAKKFLHRIVFIGWPHLAKAKVIGVSNREKYVNIVGTQELDPKVFDFQLKTAQEHLATRMGIEFADYSVLVHVKTFIGTSYTCGSQGKITINEVWSSSTTAYPAQGVVSDIDVHSSLAVKHKKIEQLFPANSKIFFVGNPYYGSEGIVMNPLLVYECGRLKVSITVLPEPDFTEAKYLQNTLERDYVNTYQAAVKIGIHVKSLARIIGSVLVVKGGRRPKSDLPENLSKLNIGLQFKYIKQQEELAGYARRVDNQWLLSSKAIDLIQLYARKFPVVIEYLCKASDRAELLFEQDLFPFQVGEKKVEEIVAWLKEQDHMKAERVACGSKTMEKASVEKILEAIEYLKTLPVKTVKLQVKPHLLLKPDVSLPDVYKPKSPINLFDRVVIVKTTYMVPLGSKGTIVGAYPVSDPNPVRLECVKAVDNFYEVLFDKHIPNGNDIHGIAHQRVYKVPESSVLLIYTQENKTNENLQDSKMPMQMENSADKITNLWRTPDNKVASSSFTGNDPFYRMMGKSAEIRQTQAVSRDSREDFWNPAVNTKQKHSSESDFWMPSNTKNKYSSSYQNLMPSFFKPSHNDFQARITASTSVIPKECNDGTNVLKSMLGLSSQTATENSGAQAQLPKPPTSWRADAQKVPVLPHNYAVMRAPQMPHCLPPNVPMANIGANIYTLPAAPPQIPQYQQQQPQVKLQYQQMHPAHPHPTHFPQHHVNNNQHLNNNQDKRFSSNSLNQRGAFIPLQVARGSAIKSSQAPTSSSAANQSESDSLATKDDVTQNLADLSLQVGGESSTTSVNPHIEIKPTYGQKKPPRIPKIGAKFDFAH